MPNSPNRLLRVAAARADFLESGPAAAAGVNDLVVASWQRSHDAGVDAIAAQTSFSGEFDTGSLLARCAEPVLDQLTADTSDMPLIVAVTDKDARVIRRVDVSPAVGRLLERVQFAPGFSYAEGAMGTNGVGTVFEAGKPISVVGPEHFTEQLQQFACSGAPIIDPVTNQVEGVLDISTLTNSWSPIMHALVKSAAKDIAQNLLLDRSQAQQAIFSTYLHASGRTRKRAVFAFGSSVFVANSVAQEQFSASEQRILREHATFLTSRRDHVTDTIVIGEGRHIHITGTRIVVGGDVVGIVMTAEVIAGGDTKPGGFDDHHLPDVAVAGAQTAQIADTLATPRPSVVTAATPAWNRACGELQRALVGERPVVLLGETGTGKFTLLAEMFHALYANARSISVDGSQLGGDSVAVNMNPMLITPTVPTLYILRNIDECTTDGVTVARRLLDTIADLDGPVWFAATISDSALDSDLPFRELLGVFEASINIPPLRCRTEDLDEIIASALKSLAPNRKIRMSPEASRVLSTYSWPRNISQLHEALAHALRRRPVGEIQVEDLPGYCQSTSRRRLTPVEASERDLMVAALKDNGGNRVAAAESLGVSRSTFYRRIKAYGIVG
ncbi:sigma-54-dependent Fis family transcriptional regulator [Gordonia sp. NPDC003424]